MYQYIAFGLNINSEIPFPELLLSEFEQADLTISLGEVPEKLQGEESIREETMAINDEEFLWDIAEVCKYYAYNGHQIIVQPYEGIDGRSIRLYLLATVMAALLHQRNSIPLHASAINIQNKLTLITGESGAGKSTSIAGLLKNGHQIFSDDVIVIQEDGKQVVSAVSSYPMIKLWDDAMVKLQDDQFNDRSYHVFPGMDKYGIFFHDEFDKNAYPIERVFVLRIKESGPIEARPLANAEAFNSLNLQAAYRDNLLHSNHLRQLNFNLLINLTKQAQVIEISRPQICNPEELLAVIQSYL